MTSIFTGNLVNGLSENHVFSSSHREMEAIGMHSFTLDSCKDIWNKNQQSLSILLNRPVSTLGDRQTILDEGGGGLGLNPGNGVYIYYDKFSETQLNSISALTCSFALSARAFKS